MRVDSELGVEKKKARALWGETQFTVQDGPTRTALCAAKDSILEIRTEE